LVAAASRKAARRGAEGCRVNEERSEPKVVLLVRLLSAIDEARYSFEELKERIGDGKPPGTRSLRRYLAILSEAGFPWYFDRASGTYRFADGYSLRRLNLTQRELLGLVTLKRLGASLGGTLASYIDETTTKLLASSDRRAANSVDTSSFAIRLRVARAGGRAHFRDAAAGGADAPAHRLRLCRQTRRRDRPPGRSVRVHRFVGTHLFGRLRSHAQ
jgi:hypothetical protein